MNYLFSSDCAEQIQALKHRDSQLYQKIIKKLKIFRENPHHPSLRLHKLKGPLQETWSISLEKNVRMLYYFSFIEGERQAVFFDIGTHDQVYRS